MRQESRVWVTYLYQVTVHLVAIEICVVTVTVSVVQADGLLGHMSKDTCLVGHDGGLVKRGLTVYQEHVAVHHVTVYFRPRVLQQQFGFARALCITELLQLDDLAVPHL